MEEYEKTWDGNREFDRDKCSELLKYLNFDQLISLTGLFAIYPANEYKNLQRRKVLNIYTKYFWASNNKSAGSVYVSINSPEIDELEIEIELGSREIEIISFKPAKDDNDVKFRRFYHQVQNARGLSMKKIVGNAFCDPPSKNEFIDYAKWGFIMAKEDQKYFEDNLSRNQLAGQYQKVNEMFLTDVGIKDWYRIGQEWFGEFDLKNHMPCNNTLKWYVINNYISKHKRQRLVDAMP